jgi:ATP-binding cassette subfamily F protein uup
MSLIAAHGLSKRYGTRTVLDDISLAIAPGERVGLIGPNGAGKSTLIGLLLGRDTPDAGELMTRRGLRTALVEQVPRIDPTENVRQALERGLRAHAALTAHAEALAAKLGALEGEALDRAIADHALATEAIERAGGWDVGHALEAMADAIGLPPRDRQVGSLSIGEQRRVAIAAALLEGPELLVLDEPTNHLDVAAIEWLETYFARWPGALLVVTHDRYFLDRVATRLFELDRGRLFTYEGNYTEHLVQKAERDAIEARTEHNRQRSIRAELEWVRRSAPARTTKQKARLDRFDALVADKPLETRGEASFRLPHPPRLGKTILELDAVSKTWGQKKVLDRVSLSLTAGARIGIVGPNGAGKTTLVRIINGELPPDSGRVVLGQNTRVIFQDQARSELDPDATVRDEVADDNDFVIVGETSIRVETFLEQLLFDGAAQRMKVGSLSGGERSRVALAKTLRQAGNLLILDEPTNDLDLATLRVLEDALVGYPGAALIISHDRAFLDRVTTAVLAFEGDGKVTLYEGGHALYRERLLEAAARRAANAAAPSVPSPTATAAAASPAARPKKRSFNEEREFQGMEAKILGLEADVATREAALQDPELLRRGREVAEQLRGLDDARAALERAYARWAELEALGG